MSTYPVDPERDTPEDEPVAIRPRGLKIVAVVLVAALAAGGFWLYRRATAPAPDRVLVAVDIDGFWWEGSPPAAKAADEIAGMLDGLGFDPVRAGDPEVAATLESAADPVEAARALGAAFVIEARFTPKVIEHPVAGGYFEVRAEGTVRVAHVGDDGSPAADAVQGWAGARERDRALEGLAESVARRTFDAALPRLVVHPALARYFDPESGAASNALIRKLDPARDYVAARNRLLRTAEKVYASLPERRRAQEKGPVPVTYHSDPAANDALCATGPEGYLVKTESITPFVSPTSVSLGWIEALETVEWRAPKGEAHLLWSGYNVYGYPTATPGGGPVALVEDLFGWAKTITVIEPTGEARRLRVDPEHRFSAPALAPGGALLAIEDRACRRGCPADLIVLATPDGAERLRLKPEGGAFDGHAWLDARRLAFLHTPAAEGDAPAGERRLDQPRQTLWIAEFGAGGEAPAPKAIYTVNEGVSLSWPRAAPDGRRLAFAYRGPEFHGLGVLDLEGPEGPHLTARDVGGRASAPAFSPDGARIAFNLVPIDDRGDREIAVVPTAGGTVTRLTDNPFEDRYPQWSADGQRIFFESLDDDPNFRRRRSVNVIASVPAAP